MSSHDLRVGLLTSEFPPAYGGVETYSWQLAKELGQRRGLKVTVYVPPASRMVTPPRGVTIKPILRSCIGLDWSSIMNEPIDVWHALSACHAWISEKDLPTVVTVHGNDFLAPYPLTAHPALTQRALWRLRPWLTRSLRPVWQHATRRMLARALPRAVAIIANSHYTAKVLKSQHPLCAGKVDVAWVGVDPVYFDVSREAGKKVTQFLTVCRLSEPRKNVDRILRALATLSDRFEFEYVVAGDGELRITLERLANSLGIGPRVRFVGSVTDSELRKLYARADLFVLPASIVPDSHEGFGIVYLEAAACGVPSLAARMAGAAEAVSDGVSGYFVERPEVEAIRKSLANYLEGKVRIDSFTCREFASEFGWGRIADKYEDAYRKARLRKYCE